MPYKTFIRLDILKKYHNQTIYKGLWSFSVKLNNWIEVPNKSRILKDIIFYVVFIILNYS